MKFIYYTINWKRPDTRTWDFYRMNVRSHMWDDDKENLVCFFRTQELAERHAALLPEGCPFEIRAVLRDKNEGHCVDSFSR